jgi:hypothetical protein
MNTKTSSAYYYQRNNYVRLEVIPMTAMGDEQPSGFTFLAGRNILISAVQLTL